MPRNSTRSAGSVDSIFCRSSLITSSRRDALGFQLHGEVAGVRLGDAGEAELQPGAAREALDVRRLLQQPLDVAQHAVGLVERRARRRGVVEDEARSSNAGRNSRAEHPVDEEGADQQHADEHERPASRRSATSSSHS